MSAARALRVLRGGASNFVSCVCGSQAKLAKGTPLDLAEGMHARRISAPPYDGVAAIIDLLEKISWSLTFRLERGGSLVSFAQNKANA